MKNKRIRCICILLLPFCFSLLTAFLMPDNFKTQQQQFSRVKTAYKEKGKVVSELFSSKGIELSSANIFIRAFKEEGDLEVWGRAGGQGPFVLIKTYEICTKSGSLGPKRKQGDGQVPEGFYEIDRFNPSSNFYLSLGLNYPNKSDKVLGKGNLGGDIFIHGNCVTIGCMPLTDDKIKEVYIMAVEAKTAGQQNIPVHVFPCRMGVAGMKTLEEVEPALMPFWKNIQKGFAFFEEKYMLPVVSVLPSGEYSFR